MREKKTWLLLSNAPNLSLSLPLIKIFAETLPSSGFWLILKTERTAGTFDNVGHGIITAFTKDIVVNCCHFCLCVITAV